MTKYDVAIFQPVIIKFKGLEAKDKEEALAKAAELVGQAWHPIKDAPLYGTKIAYMEMSEEGYYYALVDQYEGKEFGEDSNDENESEWIGPDGKTRLVNGEGGQMTIDDPRSEWMKKYGGNAP